MNLRASAQQFGLLRKFKGKLLLKSLGKRMVDDPIALWHELAKRLVVDRRHQAEGDAAMLLALGLLSGGGKSVDELLPSVAFGLSALHWSRADGGELEDSDVWQVIRDTYSALRALGVFEVDRWNDGPVTAVGREFARAMFQS